MATLPKANSKLFLKLVVLFSILAVLLFEIKTGYHKDRLPSKHAKSKAVEDLKAPEKPLYEKLQGDGSTGSELNLTDVTFTNKQLKEFGKTVFLFMKTGSDIADLRLHAHKNSTLQWYPNHNIYSDFEGEVSGLKVIDAMQFLPDEAIMCDDLDTYRKRVEGMRLGYFWRRTSLKGKDGENKGWLMDKYKNIPAFAHGFLENPNYDWYYMMDADTLTFPTTLMAATYGMDPSDIHYFGRSVGPQQFVHGGAGILVSRGLLQKMFGNSIETAKPVIKRGYHHMTKTCCGDDAFSRLAKEMIPGVYNEWEEAFDAAYFQGAKSFETKANVMLWCNPIGTLHHMEPYDVETLSYWYEEKRRTNNPSLSPTNFDWYEDYIMPHVKEELPGYVLHFKIEYGVRHGPAYVFRDDDHAKDKNACKKTCQDNKDCYAWSFYEKNNCEIIEFGVVPALRYEYCIPQYESKYKDAVSGYMVDRILEVRANAKCDPYKTTVFESKEGWQADKSFDFVNFQSFRKW